MAIKKKADNDQSNVANNIAFNTLAANAVRNQIFDGRLNNVGDQRTALYDTFGYKLSLSFDDFMFAYKRQGIAKRIIDATVDFTWKDLPTVVDEEGDANKSIMDDDDEIGERYNKFKANRKQRRRIKITKNIGYRLQNGPDVGTQYTPFEEGIYTLFKKFPMLRLFKKADRLNCIGQFSIMVIGTVEGKMSEPLPRGTGLDDITMFNVYSERQVQIQEWERNKEDPRFGLPTMYNITLLEDGGVSVNYRVHHSRVIHIAEDLVDSEVYGTPKLEAIYNELSDMLKVVGGSAEMFWLGAYQGIVFNVKDGYELKQADADAMTEQIQNYVDKLQRFMKTKGVEVQTISSPVASPEGNFNTLIKLISGASNIPTRILIGSEQGQLAASVDQDTFFSYITSRRNSFINEAILTQLIDRLVEHDYLPEATNNEYYIEWPALFELTDAEKLSNAEKIINSIKAMNPINPLSILPVEELRTLLTLPEEVPETQYEDLADLGSFFDEYGDDLDLLPNEDDTEVVAQEYDPLRHDYISLKAVAKHLDIGEGTVRNWCKTNALPHYRIGSRYKFRMQEVEDWVLEGNNQSMVSNKAKSFNRSRLQSAFEKRKKRRAE